MQDLISRQAAIEELNSLMKLASETIVIAENPVCVGVESARIAIEKLPSAHPLDPCETCLHKGKGWDEEPCDGCTGKESKYEPDNGWIPVSERLPENDYAVLVYEPGDGEFSVYAARYDKKSGWEYRDDMSTAIPPKPIAWQPLPDPYGVEE